MITKTELSEIWSDITPSQGQNVGRRADPSHPLDFFVTYDEKYSMQFILLTDFEPKLPNSSKQLFVRVNKRSDGNYAVCFSLEDNQLRDQYLSLCWDIMDSTYSALNQIDGVKDAINRFRMWQNLFAEEKNKKLSETELKGLIGELSVLKDICIKRYGAEKAIAGWLGPVGADRDFEYDDIWLESKYVSLSMDKVKISSLDQLDVERTGYLVLCRAEKTAVTATEYLTLNELVNSIEQLVQDNENSFVSFKNRLALAGYDSLDERSNYPFVVHRFETYMVDEKEFPALKRSSIHAAITDGEYKLSIPALQHWRTDIK